MAPGDGARHRWRIDGCGVVGPRSTMREKRGPEVQAGAEGVLCLHLRGQANQTTKAKSWRTPNGGRIRIALASFSKVAFLSGVSLPAPPLLQTCGTLRLRDAVGNRKPRTVTLQLGDAHGIALGQAYTPRRRQANRVEPR